MLKYSDIELINFLIKENADIEAPEPPDSLTWVIYTKDKPLGAGAGCSMDLRLAIEIAIDNESKISI